MTPFAKTLATTTAALVLMTSLASAADLKLRSDSGRKVQPRGGAQVLNGVTPLKPDLVVSLFNAQETGQPNTGVCGAWIGTGYKDVRMRIHNIGHEAIGLTSLTILLQKSGSTVGSTVIQIPPLQPGQQKAVTFAVPQSAQPGLSENLQIKAKADAPNHEAELSETNNTLTSYCAGPAA